MKLQQTYQKQFSLLSIAGQNEPLSSPYRQLLLRRTSFEEKSQRFSDVTTVNWCFSTVFWSDMFSPGYRSIPFHHPLKKTSKSCHTYGPMGSHHGDVRASPPTKFTLSGSGSTFTIAFTSKLTTHTKGYGWELRSASSFQWVCG